MKKLKQQHNITLIHCNLFLQNNFNKINSKQILYKNQNLLINKQFNMIEFQHIKNINIALTAISKFNNIVSIQSQYNNKFLFNYKMNYQIHKLFHKIVCCNAYQRTYQLLRGRILGRKNYKHTKLYVSIFGVVYVLRSKNLLLFLHHLVTNKYIPMQYLKDQNDSNSNKYIPNYLRKRQFANKIINKYMLKPLLFKIKLISQNKFIISRRAFIKYLFAQQRIIRRNHALILKQKTLKLQKFLILIETYKKEKKLKDFLRKLRLREKKKLEIKKKQFSYRLKEDDEKRKEIQKMNRLKEEEEKQKEIQKMNKFKEEEEKRKKKQAKKLRKKIRLQQEEDLKSIDLTQRTFDLTESLDQRDIPGYLKPPFTADEIRHKKDDLRKNYNLLIQQKKLLEKDEIKKQALLKKQQKNKKEITPEKAKELFLEKLKFNKFLDRNVEPRPLNESGNPVNFAVDFITPPSKDCSDYLRDFFLMKYAKDRQFQLTKMNKDFKFYQDFKIQQTNKHQRRRNRKKKNMLIMRKRNAIIFDDINTKNNDYENNTFS